MASINPRSDVIVVGNTMQRNNWALDVNQGWHQNVDATQKLLQKGSEYRLLRRSAKFSERSRQLRIGDRVLRTLQPLSQLSNGFIRETVLTCLCRLSGIKIRIC